MTSFTWEEHFKSLLRVKGYEPLHISHDPLYGWTVLYSDGERDREFEAQTTVGVSRRIERLKRVMAPEGPARG